MNKKTNILEYQIRIQGHLPNDWSDWMGNVKITNLPNGETIILGEGIDQARLHGLLQRIRDLGLNLIEVKQIESETKKEIAIERSKSIEKQNSDSYMAAAHQWSIVIIALGLSAIRTGNESGNFLWLWLGGAIFIAGSFLWVYKHYYNLGIIIAIVGGSLLLLGNPTSNSTLFGKALSEVEKSPMLIWGVVLTVIGIAGWAYIRYGRKK